MATTTAFFLLALVAFGTPALFVVLARAFGPRRPDEIKSSAFESGIEPRVDARRRQAVGYYRAALAVAGFVAAVVLLGHAVLVGVDAAVVVLGAVVLGAALLRVLDQGVRSWD